MPYTFDGEELLDTIGAAICEAFEVPPGEAPRGQAVVVREAIFNALGFGPALDYPGCPGPHAV